MDQGTVCCEDLEHSDFVALLQSHLEHGHSCFIRVLVQQSPSPKPHSSKSPENTIGNVYRGSEGLLRPKSVVFTFE
jgi:hypothetical protein